MDFFLLNSNDVNLNLLKLFPLQKATAAANTVLLESEGDKKRQHEELQKLRNELKKKTYEINSINRAWDLSRKKYTRVLENNRDISEKLEKEKEQSDKLREFIVRQNSKLNSTKVQNNKLQMQIDALELCAKDLSLNAYDITEKETDKGWCTPRRFDEAGDNMCIWVMKA